MGRLFTLVVFVPIAAGGLGFYGGFGYSTSPWNDMAAVGFFFGAEREVSAVSLMAEYRYSGFDWDRTTNPHIPEEHPVYEWVTHTVTGGVKYRFGDSRVSPYISADVGLVWYDYNLVLFGGWDVPVDNPALMVSFGAGVDVAISGPVSIFADAGYVKHFTKILNRYGELGPDGDYEYTDITYSGLNVKAGLSVNLD